jgi:hypothetical protein
MIRHGHCHCGAVSYETAGEPISHSLCHCSDCRGHAGAPMVAWAMFKSDQVKIIKGEPKIYASSQHGRRYFCGQCGTGLLYTNDQILPDITDVQSATFDDPNSLAPAVHVQTAERIAWMENAHHLPTFERYPFHD